MVDLHSFHEQVKRGDLAGVKAAVAEDSALIDAANEEGQSAFLLAKYYRHEELANYLLSFGPKLDLFAACAAGRTSDVLERIDSDPAMLGEHSSDGWTPLHLAAFFGHTELAKGLLNRGMQVDQRSTNPMKNTPLHAAAAGGQIEVMRLLLENGADASAQQHGGWTALHTAAQTGNRAMFELLLAHGAHVHARADNNQAPLDLALLYGHEEIANLLDRQGAKLS
ncbi:MAG: ankyrin repeat domain-containing protein [Bryobacteraceae bacterium]